MAAATLMISSFNKSMHARLIFLTTVLFCSFASTTSAPWTAREEYPDYCSSPDAMNQRSIPPVNNVQQLEGLHLLQVVAAIRHGSRTPWERHDCWNGYQDDPVQSRWDCDLTTVTAPMKNPDQNSSITFNKVYDALSDPLTNELSGTCQKGQLLLIGREQEERNGQYLRNAYLSDVNDDSMKLFNSSHYDEVPYKNAIYFRSDDDQRVLMSGQVLLESMFDVSEDTMMVVHTADRSVDILEPNPATCPRLTSIELESKSSSEYAELLSSDLSKGVEQVLYHINATIAPMMDCMMTAICNDRPLPDILNDFLSIGDDSTFSKVEAFWTQQATFPFEYIKGEYSKLSMAPIWSDILSAIRRATEADNLETMKNNGVPKFFLISGHDLTLLPMLIALGPKVWDKKWIPYASMLIIEVYSFSSAHSDFLSNKAFRLVYNGKVITNLMNECESELCDIENLLSHIGSFATRERNCAGFATNNTMPRLRSSSSFGQITPISVIFAVICSIASSLVMYAYMKRSGKEVRFTQVSNIAVPSIYNDAEII